MYGQKKGEFSVLLVIALFVIGTALLLFQYYGSSITGAPTFYDNGTVCLQQGESFLYNGHLYEGPGCYYYGPPCTPKTCSELNAECGSILDGCDGTLNCGSCQSGYNCQNNKCVCQPKTCLELSAECGTIDNGCGTQLNCGSCLSPDVCENNACVAPFCTPKTCAELGAQCGTIDDGCAGTLNCGSCPSGQVCNTATNQCGLTCVSTTCEALGAACGNPSDGCGGILACGNCAENETCDEQNNCVSLSGPEPIPEPFPGPIPDEELFPLSPSEIKEAFETEQIKLSITEETMGAEELAVLGRVLSPEEESSVEKYSLSYTNALSSPVTVTISIEEETLSDLPQQENLIRKLLEQVSVFFSEKEAEKIVQQKITALQWMDYEEMHTLLGRAIGKSSPQQLSISGMSYSGQIVEGHWLLNRFLNCNRESVTLPPGETITQSCYARKAFSLKLRPAIRLILSAQGETVFVKALPEEQDRKAAAVIELVGNNRIDVYAQFPPAEDKEHYVEINVRRPSDGFWSTIFSSPEFSDVYGPFNIGKEGLFLTQQFEYNPSLYHGKYVVSITLYQGLEKLGENKYGVILGERIPP